MDERELTGYIRGTFAGLRVLEHAGDTFFVYDPDADLPPERQQPFATVVTGDHYEKVSMLDARPGAYRVNIGVTKATYTSLFGPPPTTRDADGLLDTGHDQTAVDTLLPHPVYASQYWVCVVDPAAATTGTVRDLLAEAYTFAVRKYTNHRARTAPGPTTTP